MFILKILTLGNPLFFISLNEILEKIAIYLNFVLYNAKFKP